MLERCNGVDTGLLSGVCRIELFGADECLECTSLSPACERQSHAACVQRVFESDVDMPDGSAGAELKPKPSPLERSERTLSWASQTRWPRPGGLAPPRAPSPHHLCKALATGASCFDVATDTALVHSRCDFGRVLTSFSSASTSREGLKTCFCNFWPGLALGRIAFQNRHNCFLNCSKISRIIARISRPI